MDYIRAFIERMAKKGVEVKMIYIIGNRARYVVYGHTHRAEEALLDVVPMPDKKEIVEKIYFNTGTCRKVFEHTKFDEEKCEFIGWHVMTVALFYLESEKERERNYEVWAGSLGQRRT